MMIIPTPTVEEEILSLESMVSWLWKLSKVKAFITKMLSLENLGWTPLMISVLANGRQDFNPGLLSLKHFSLDYIIEYVIYSTTLNKKFVYWKKIDYNTRFFLTSQLSRKQQGGCLLSSYHTLNVFNYMKSLSLPISQWNIPVL